MSDKMFCPGCESDTSTVLAHFLDGDPCPYCQLPHEAAAAILTARRKTADADLTKRYEEAITRATRAEAERDKLIRHLAGLRDLMDRFDKPGEGGGW